MIPEPSVAEIEIKEEINKMSSLVASTLITIADAKKLIASSYKVLYKCEELRNSRDKWMLKYKEVNDELKKISAS